MNTNQRCEACGSSNVQLALEFEGDPWGVCLNCGNEGETYVPTNLESLPKPWWWENFEGMVHLNMPIADGVKFWREEHIEDGKREMQIFTNVPPYCRDRSTFEWGYSGSGPSRFALNILEATLRELKWQGPRMQKNDLGPSYNANCYKLAWKLHHPFKQKFLASASYDGGWIGYDEIVGWIEEQRGSKEW